MGRLGDWPRLETHGLHGRAGAPTAADKHADRLGAGLSPWLGLSHARADIPNNSNRDCRSAATTLDERSPAEHLRDVLERPACGGRCQSPSASPTRPPRYCGKKNSHMLRRSSAGSTGPMEEVKAPVATASQEKFFFHPHTSIVGHIDDVKICATVECCR